MAGEHIGGNASGGSGSGKARANAGTPARYSATGPRQLHTAGAHVAEPDGATGDGAAAKRGASKDVLGRQTERREGKMGPA